MSDVSVWRTGFFRRMMIAMHKVEADNFDALRYQGISPQSFFLDQHAWHLDHFVEHSADFYRSRQLLADEASRELFDLLLLFRVLGHLHVRLPLSDPVKKEARIPVPDDWKVADTDEQTMFGPLSIFCVPVGDDQVWVKAWPANVSAYLGGQYYFERNGERIAPREGDHVIDAGGCFGDTALFFAHSIGRTGRVYTFDPLRKHCDIMRDAFRLNSELEARISIFEAGVSDADQAGEPDATGVIDPGARVDSPGIALRSIDSMLAGGEIARVDFVKMDIEGSELAALKGAVGALRTFKPRLAISLYHRAEDFYAIPLWLDSLGLGYRFFLDHYSIHHEETVLYATAA
ncbi:MAG: FkbM family methyltransferase [Burkholderiales bacterium]|nr:FkbM family methyltransferase [Burkholderiales bacterium]